MTNFCGNSTEDGTKKKQKVLGQDGSINGVLATLAT